MARQSDQFFEVVDPNRNEHAFHLSIGSVCCNNIIRYKKSNNVAHVLFARHVSPRQQVGDVFYVEV